MGTQDVTSFLEASGFARFESESTTAYIDRAVEAATSNGLSARIAATALSAMFTSRGLNAHTRQFQEALSKAVSVPQMDISPVAGVVLEN